MELLEHALVTLTIDRLRFLCRWHPQASKGLVYIEGVEAYDLDLSGHLLVIFSGGFMPQKMYGCLWQNGNGFITEPEQVEPV